jgi:hypothetical protein
MSQSLENEEQGAETLGDELLEQVVGGTGPEKPEASLLLPRTRREDASRVGGLNTSRKRKGEDPIEYLPFGLHGPTNPPKKLRTDEGSSSGQKPSTFKPYIPDLNK